MLFFSFRLSLSSPLPPPLGGAALHGPTSIQGIRLLALIMPSLGTMASHGQVVDIGGSEMRNFVETRLKRCLTAVHKPGQPPTLPDELLYDEDGLLIWNDIIEIPEFYQTQDEIEIFERNAVELVQRVQPGVTMIDLGAGCVSPFPFDSNLLTIHLSAAIPRKSSICSPPLNDAGPKRPILPSISPRRL